MNWSGVPRGAKLEFAQKMGIRRLKQSVRNVHEVGKC